jgi:hypothetical protein
MYEGRLKRSWTGGNAPLLYCYASLCITAAHYRQSTNFLNGPRSCSAILKKKISFKTTVTLNLTTVRGLKIAPLLRYTHHYNMA